MRCVPLSASCQDSLIQLDFFRVIKFLTQDVESKFPPCLLFHEVEVPFVKKFGAICWAFSPTMNFLVPIVVIQETSQKETHRSGEPFLYQPQVQDASPS